MLNWIACRTSQITLMWLQVKQKGNLYHYIPKRVFETFKVFKTKDKATHKSKLFASYYKPIKE